jgi:alternate signal-mediated exported protein
MNKLLKGAIAGAAGVALLLGGAGTFALWNSSATVTGGNIVAGNLLVSDPGPVGTWAANGVNVPVLSAFKAVPGDVLTYTKTIAVAVTGNNLVATLGLGAASISPSTASGADSALAAYLTKTAVLTATGTGIVASGGNYTITSGTAGVSQNVTVTATITFPKSLTAGFENTSKLGSVSLDNLAVTLTQN